MTTTLWQLALAAFAIAAIRALYRYCVENDGELRPMHDPEVWGDVSWQTPTH